MTRINILSVVLVTYFISACEASSPANSAERKSSAVHDESYKHICETMADIIEKIPLEYFEGDAQLEQYVDTLNQRTSYKLRGSGKQGVPIYERNSNDDEQEAVVLLPSEDKIPIKKAKRVYVGLRAADEDNLYYVIYIYLR